MSQGILLLPIRWVLGRKRTRPMVKHRGHLGYTDGEVHLAKGNQK